jgi:hypothetical protein
LHGGYDGLQNLEDTWEWAGESWKRVALAGPLRGEGGMVFDSRRGVTVLFGGYAFGLLHHSAEPQPVGRRAAAEVDHQQPGPRLGIVRAQVLLELEVLEGAVLPPVG